MIVSTHFHSYDDGIIAEAAVTPFVTHAAAGISNGKDIVEAASLRQAQEEL